MNDFVPAPAFRVSVTAFAWTEAQADLIRRQVEHMFAGAEVIVTPNNPPAVDPVPIVAVTESQPVEAKPVVAVVPTPALPRVVPEGSPVVFDQLLTDIHTGAIVKVTDISDSSFTWQNTDPNASENARNGICPFASFPACYEIPPSTQGDEASETQSVSGPDSPTAGLEPAAVDAQKKSAEIDDPQN